MALDQTSCPQCGHRFDPRERGAPPPELLELLPPPPGMTVAAEGGGLVLRRRWFHPGALFLLLFAVVWDGFLAVWYTIGLGMLLQGQSEALLMLLFPVLHVAVGVTITWQALSQLLNTTALTLRAGTLSVRHGPIALRQPPPVPTDTIQQLWVSRRHGSKGRVTWEVHLRREDGTADRLLSGLPEYAQARFVETRVEAALGIADRAMDGEARP